jgi:hypothetical protein
VMFHHLVQNQLNHQSLRHSKPAFVALNTPLRLEQVWPVRLSLEKKAQALYPQIFCVTTSVFWPNIWLTILLPSSDPFCSAPPCPNRSPILSVFRYCYADQ